MQTQDKRSPRAALAALLAMLMLAPVLSGCEREQGPMEEMGESMDEAATDFGNAVEDECEEMKERMDAKDTDC